MGELTFLKPVPKDRIVEVNEEKPRRLFSETDSSELREVVEAFWRKYKGRAYLSFLSVVDFAEEGVFRVDYVFYLMGEKKLLTIRVRVPRDNPRLPSIADIVPAASAYEREAYDLFGIAFENNSHPGEGAHPSPRAPQPSSATQRLEAH